MNLPYLLIVSLVSACIFLLGLRLYNVNPVINGSENIKSETAWTSIRIGLLNGLSHGVLGAILWFASDMPAYYFHCVSSEWGLQSTEDYILTSVYFLLWNALSAVSHYFVCTKLKFTFDDPAKSKKLFAFTSITVGIIFWLFLTAVAFMLNM